jgi:RimJ/RimL family protein N-acetyltransferase
MSNLEPKGDFVSGPPALVPDINAANVILSGKNPSLCQTVELRPLIQASIPDLYANICGPQNDHLYTYLPSGPYHDLPSFTKLINDGFVLTPSFFPFAIFSSDPIHVTNQSLRTDSDKARSPVGIICLMNIVPSHRSIEIGHVLLAPTLQRTTAATEGFYLLMKYAFEELGYLRVEWKCNNFNEPSKRAALRLGYTFEGIFRKQYVKLLRFYIFNPFSHNP